MIKKYISLALLLTLVVCQPAFASSMGDYSRVGAVVGKVITYDKQKDKYIVFGRMSILTEKGYKVYETGKFYSLCPDTESADKLIKENMGKGIKAFGVFEAVKQTTNQEILLVKKVEKYDPSKDGLEPAYGRGIGPEPWLGFGIPVSPGTAKMMAIQKPWDFVWMTEKFKRLLPPCDLELQVEDNKHSKTLVENTKTKETYDPKELAEHLTSDIIKSFNDPKKATAFKKPFRQFWQETFKENYLMEKNEKSYQDILRGIKGWTFLETQKGRLNHLIEEVPVIRPEMDIFLQTVERLLSSDPEPMEQWATPALFYGIIDPSYTAVKTTSGEMRLVYSGGHYTGPYYATKEQLIDAILCAINKNSLPESKNESPESCNNNIEKWPIGWGSGATGQEGKKSGEAKSVKGLTILEIMEVKDHPSWMIGTRVLVYKIEHVSKDGERTVSWVHVEYGNMEEGTFESPDGGSTTVTLDAYYIKPWIDIKNPNGTIKEKISSIMPKPAYNYLLSALRDIAIKGGF